MQSVALADPATDEDPLGHGKIDVPPVQNDPVEQVAQEPPFGP